MDGDIEGFSRACGGMRQTTQSALNRTIVAGNIARDQEGRQVRPHPYRPGEPFCIMLLLLRGYHTGQRRLAEFSTSLHCDCKCGPRGGRPHGHPRRGA